MALCDIQISNARILEWITVPFSRGSFQPKDQTCISCTAGRFPTAEPLGKPFNTNIVMEQTGITFKRTCW